MSKVEQMEPGIVLVSHSRSTTLVAIPIHAEEQRGVPHSCGQTTHESSRRESMWHTITPAMEAFCAASRQLADAASDVAMAAAVCGLTQVETACHNAAAYCQARQRKQR